MFVHCQFLRATSYNYFCSRHSDVLLSEQDDGSFFWAYMSGTISTAWGYLQPLENENVFAGSDSMKARATFAKQQMPMLPLGVLNALDKGNDALPLGMVIDQINPDRNNIPPSFAGAWSSDTLEQFFGSEEVGTDVQVVFRKEDGYELFDFSCAQVSLSGESISALCISPTLCTASTSGPSPTGTCFLFNGNIYLHYLFPDLWKRDTVQFYTASVQQTGDLWFSWHHGPVVKANALLAR